MATNPMIQPGTLNRVRAHVVVPAFTSLNITPSFMTRNYVTVSFDDNFVDQIPTAVGVVNSPAPFVMATISVGLIRTQPLANTWLTQVSDGSVLGEVVVHSDTAAFPAVTVYNTSVTHLQPGPFDGMDPTVQLTMRGVYYINNSLWSGL